MRALVGWASALLLLATATTACAPGAGYSGNLGAVDGGGAGHRVRKRATDVAAFRETDLVTLALDGRTMRNAQVRVRGQLYADSPDRVTLRDSGGRARVAANVRNLEPAEKQWIAANCASPCDAEILGVVQAPLGTSTFYIDAYFLGNTLPQPG